ncbi:MAG TPA: flavin reductase family protein [Thermoanaerobaculia bacterium]|nr:flavin reductase family protein [Thermoanaerobaculia bacterium]
MPIDEAGFRRAMSQFASGITIVTVEHEGTLYGMTVSSFASVSLRPPLVLVCIETQLKTHSAIIGAGSFGVSILGHGQEALSTRFATRTDDRFAGLELRRGELGTPLLAKALATIECRLHAQLPGGDHSIFVGEVLDAVVTESDPLLYFRGGYRELR